jgi:hypothetical protein
MKENGIMSLFTIYNDNAADVLWMPFYQMIFRVAHEIVQL